MSTPATHHPCTCHLTRGGHRPTAFVADVVANAAVTATDATGFLRERARGLVSDHINASVSNSNSLSSKGRGSGVSSSSCGSDGGSGGS